jgi:ethanolamine phosphate transferase 2 subunit G
MLKVVVETFPEFQKAGVSDNCEDFLGSINKLACQWRKIAVAVADEKEDDDMEPWARDVNKVCVLVV